MGRSAMTIDSPRVKAQAHLGDVAALPKSNLNIPSKMNPCTPEAGGGATRRISFSLTTTEAPGAAAMPASTPAPVKEPVAATVVVTRDPEPEMPAGRTRRRRSAAA